MQQTEAGIFSPDHCIFLPLWDMLGYQPLLKVLLPFLLLFACSSTFPGKVTRGKPFDRLQFFDCEIQAKTQPRPCWSSQGNCSLSHSLDKEDLGCLKMKEDSTGWGKTFTSFHICSWQMWWAHTCLPSLPLPPRTTLHHNVLGTIWI